MNPHELVDELYEAFAQRLGEPFSTRARELPSILRLSTKPGVPWSRVFSHEVTLGAPALFAGDGNIANSLVRDAVMAHLLAVIDAFGTDRMEDKQVEANPDLLGMLELVRTERDRAMSRLFGGSPPLDLDFAISDAMTARAIRRERALLYAGTRVDIALYELSSLDKQSAGLLASVALVRAAGWDERACRAVRMALESVALGLQTYDDVVDWEDDAQRGGSWAVCLMNGMEVGLREPPIAGSDIRTRVLRSGVLRVMLERALRHMRAARRLAMTVGAQRLAAWAGARESRLDALVLGEARHPGYAVRAHALEAWAEEVLT